MRIYVNFFLARVLPSRRRAWFSRSKRNEGIRAYIYLHTASVSNYSTMYHVLLVSRLDHILLVASAVEGVISKTSRYYYDPR